MKYGTTTIAEPLTTKKQHKLPILWGECTMIDSKDDHRKSYTHNKKDDAMQ